METSKVYDLAGDFADKVDYRTRLLRPETWFEYFINKAVNPEYIDFLVFCETTERYLSIQKLMDIEKAFIIGVEIGMLEFDKKEV